MFRGGSVKHGINKINEFLKPHHSIQIICPLIEVYLINPRTLKGVCREYSGANPPYAD